MTARVPFARPDIGEEEIAEVVATLRSGWLTTGPRTRRFEEAFAHLVDVPWALGTSSCTGALHLSLAALGVGPGDEVIVPTMTFAATANVVVHTGARPVFVDVDPVTLTVSPDAVACAMTPRTRAVMAVHYAGRMCDMPGLLKVATARGVSVVEDAAHAVGASLAGRAAGAWGDAAGFSFYANKNLTTGEGGMLTTASEDLYTRARTLRLQGLSRDAFLRAEGTTPAWRYDVVAAGFKYPMSDLEAAIGIHQLARLPEMQTARRRLAARYDQGLGDVPGLSLPALPGPGMVHAHHLYVVRVTAGARMGRDALYAALAARGIECSVHFTPLHLHPYFRERWGTREGQLPAAEAAFAEVLSLPLFSRLTEEDQDRVIDAVTELLGA